MTDPIPLHSPQPTGHPFRGTQPLTGPHAAAAPKPAEAPSKPLSMRDVGAIASGTDALEAFIDQSGSMAEIQAQAEALLRQLDPLDQAIAERVFQDLFNPPDFLNHQGDQLRAFLQKMLHRIQLHVEARVAEHRFIENRISFAWAMIMQSLERYIANLETSKLIDKNFLDRKLNDEQSENELDERLMVASQGQGPEHTFSLLSANLND